MQAVLTLQNISAYGPDGQALLPPLDLTIFPGERVRVVTEPPRFEALAQIIGGLLEPDGGEAALLGRPVGEWAPPERAGQVGYAPAEPGFWEGMTVADNTALPLMAVGVAKRERRDAALEALERVGLGYAAHTYPKSLSLGERRLAALARALVRGPALVLLAQPASMLDEKETARFAAALAGRREAAGFAAVYSGGEILPADKTIHI